MRKSIILWVVIALLPFALWLFPPRDVSAQPRQQGAITTPGQLIDAVNGLRLAYGLPPLTVHAVLMQSSQSQADYMAATGQITHERPSGVSFTQQLLMLGFPLSGDLSLGGYRAENILMGPEPIVWTSVPAGWQDSDHMNTMLSQNYTHIGAGVSQGPDGYYYALDCAAATRSGQMQSNVPSILTGVPNSDEPGENSLGISQYMVPVALSTARPDGDVFHKVQYGQSLWSIAIEYDTTIKNIQALNYLGEDLVVYQGQELLVKKAATQPPMNLPTLTSTPEFLFTPAMLSTPMPLDIFSGPDTFVSVPTSTLVEEKSVTNQSSSKLFVGLLIVASFVGGAIAVWLIRDPN